MAKVEGALVWVDVETRLQELDAAIRRVSERTGKSIVEIVHESAVIFSREAGRAMKPSGKWAQPGKKRKREIYRTSMNEFFNIKRLDPSIIGGRRPKKAEGIATVSVKISGERRYKKHYGWRKSSLKNYGQIKSHGTAKAQFWEAMKQLGANPPRGAIVGPIAERVAVANVSVNQDKSTDPATTINSSVRTAAGQRPYAIVTALGKTRRNVRAWARRLEQEQQKAWQ
jgi:hypothetical protein